MQRIGRLLFLLILFSFFAMQVIAAESQPAKPSDEITEKLGISANPGAVDISVGSGRAQKFFMEQAGAKDDHGVKLGGMWLSDVDGVLSGGVKPGSWTANSLLILDLHIDAEKLLHWQGASFGAEFLQFNGSDTNGDAGTVQGYNSLPGEHPLNRSELYQLWYRQELFGGKLIFRIGKSAPTFHFGNLLRPTSNSNTKTQIPSVSSATYTPIFVNPTMLGVLPGYYNSAYGLVLTAAPLKQFYFNAGVFDGNMARGKQTGISVLPEFNGYYFTIGEAGVSWLLGGDEKPGNVGLGAWYQSGKLEREGVSQNGNAGFYLFGSQRLWYMHPGEDDSGLSFFYQFGANNSQVISARYYLGGGLTAFQLIPHRPLDSMGVGLAFSWLNQDLLPRSNELLFQAYYQAHIIYDLYVQPVITYIPNPGASSSAGGAVASTLRLMFFF